MLPDFRGTRLAAGATAVFYRGLDEMLPRHACRLALALVALLAAGVPRATAASKMKIAAAGDAAPGGGVFAGPGFSGWPTAAGNGWIRHPDAAA